jgi:hypothetical protein
MVSLSAVRADAIVALTSHPQLGEHQVSPQGDLGYAKAIQQSWKMPFVVAKTHQ